MFHQAPRAKVLAADTVSADETHWPLVGTAVTSRWWSCCLVSDDLATYRILSVRSQRAAEKMLAGYQGTVTCDGFGT